MARTIFYCVAALILLTECFCRLSGVLLIKININQLTGIIKIIILIFQFYTRVEGIGVNYGRLADNLPPPDRVVGLIKSNNIRGVRLFDPNPDALLALRGSGIQVILGVVNNDLPGLSNEPAFAAFWVQTNVVPYASSVNFRCIAVGNELIPSNLAVFVLPAMQGLKNALNNANLHIPVSTAVFQNVLSTSFPPSAGDWHHDAAPFMVPIVHFLSANNYPLLCNIYTYFPYRDDTKNVRLDYALINTTEVVVRDGELGYTNLFDAAVDGIYSALEKVGAANVEVVVSETGWPSGGKEEMANIGYAQTYINNLIAHVSSTAATPKRPGKPIETYIFALFNEDLKPAGSEQHYGLFNPDMTPAYRINFPAY